MLLNRRTVMDNGILGDEEMKYLCESALLYINRPDIFKLILNHMRVLKYQVVQSSNASPPAEAIENLLRNS